METRRYKNIEVREDGAFRNVKKECFSFGENQTKGNYIFVCCGGKSEGVHRVMYRAFHGDFDEKMAVHHIDRNPRNNAISNLQLTTVSENNQQRDYTNIACARNNNMSVVATNLEDGTTQIFPSLYKTARCFNCSAQAIKNACETNKQIKKIKPPTSFSFA